MADPVGESDERLERELQKDAEDVEKAQDPLGLGLDPEQGRAIREMAKKRTRA